MKKKDGSPRFCVLNRNVKNFAKRDVYALLHTDGTLNRLRPARYFPSMDLNRSYRQIGANELGREKTAFVILEDLHNVHVMHRALGTSSIPVNDGYHLCGTDLADISHTIERLDAAPWFTKTRTHSTICDGFEAHHEGQRHPVAVKCHTGYNASPYYATIRCHILTLQ